jgi:hypothetical protein
MDGLNVKFSGEVIREYFVLDSKGSLIPRVDLLRKDVAQKRVERQLSADTGLYRRMTEMYYRTDVEFTDNPLGNTPVIGAGIKLFGPRPMTGLKFRGRIENLAAPDDAMRKRLEKRERKIEQYRDDLLALHKSLEPADKESMEYAMWLIEGDQALTGGGFDNNAAGEVHKSALKFISKAESPIDYADTEASALVVQSALQVRDHLIAGGMKLGSLSPDGATKVRYDQDTDGMIGFPVYASANTPLTKEIATRLLIERGIDTRSFVGTKVVDKHSGLTYEYRVIDAIAYVLDHSVFSTGDLQSIVTLLARIQKHGWKYEDGKLTSKPGKTRSVYPNSAIEGMIEAMIASPFLREVQRLKIDFLPSLQDKPTRVKMISDLLGRIVPKGYDLLPADSSQYDATVKGAIFATTLYYAVRPFYRAEYHEWFDRAIQILTFKHIIFDEFMAKIWTEEFAEAEKVAPHTPVKKPFILFSTTNGLISGAKFTHVGGSLYGEVVIHLCIPRLLGYEPVIAPQAGDDTLMAFPISMIKETAEDTYASIEEAAARFGLEINKTKQMWHVVMGELIKVFLQENYHVATGIYGLGTIFRPLSAMFMSEREKGLDISEQMMAEIARANQGHDSPFAAPGVRFWLEREQVLATIFKDYGVSGFEVLVKAIGDDLEQVAKRIDVGSFSWGIGVEDLRTGALPILPIMADQSAELKVDVQLSEALKMLKAESVKEPIDLIPDSSFQTDEDILDD